MEKKESIFKNNFQEINKITEKFSTLLDLYNQKLKENNIIDAVNHFEQNLTLYVQYYDYTQPTIIFANETMQILSNKCIQLFERGNKYDAIKCLEKLSQLSANFSCQWQILNDLSCCYRNVKENKKAFWCLEQVLRKTGLQQNELAATHLNMCAILSQTKKHKKAREHALYAMQLLKETLINKGKDEKVLSILSIAYYNLGVEEEYLSQIQDAVY